jgi:hypothetical protein
LFLSFRWLGFDVPAPICCHIGRVSFVMGMTEGNRGM